MCFPVSPGFPHHHNRYTQVENRTSWRVQGVLFLAKLGARIILSRVHIIVLFASSSSRDVLCLNPATFTFHELSHRGTCMGSVPGSGLCADCRWHCLIQALHLLRCCCPLSTCINASLELRRWVTFFSSFKVVVCLFFNNVLQLQRRIQTNSFRRRWSFDAILIRWIWP